MSHKDEQIFLEKNPTIGIVAAEWVPDIGKPDHPSYWNTMRVRLEDGTRLRVSRDFVAANELRWAGIA